MGKIARLDPAPGRMVLVGEGRRFLTYKGKLIPPMAGAAGAFGTLTTLDTLKTVLASVLQYGEVNVWEAFSAILDAANRQAAQVDATLIERTTDVRRAYGGGAAKVMQVLDQFGAPDAQKVTSSTTVDFPMDRYGDALQWTRQFFMTQPVAQLAAEFQAILTADSLNFLKQTKKAIYGPTNYTFRDYLGQPAGIDLSVKAFINADGSVVPPGPNGESFNGSTHTHYLATASVTAANLTALITTVQEHYNVGVPVVTINTADEATMRGLSGFVPAIDPRLIVATTTTLPAERLNNADLYNRMIGYFGPSEVWIRPWALPNYWFAYVRGAPGGAPLVMRLPQFGGLENLTLMAEDEEYPLRARTYERQFGIGVWNRTNGAVLQINNGTYQAPTIT